MPSPVARNTGRAATSKHRGGHISKFAGITCIALAVLVDMLQALLVLIGALSGAFSVTLIGLPLAVAGLAMTFLGSLVLSSLAYLAFGFYFLFIARVRFLTGRQAVSRIGALFGSFVFELAPFFNGFPWLSMGVVHIVRGAWQEEAQAKGEMTLGSLLGPRKSPEKPAAVQGANDNMPASRSAPRAPAPLKKEIPTPRRFTA